MNIVITSFARRGYIDVPAVQETKLSSDEGIEGTLVPFLSKLEMCVSHAVGISSGCFLVLKKCLRLSSLSVITDKNDCFIVTDFVLLRKEYRVVWIYAPKSVAEGGDFSHVCYRY